MNESTGFSLRERRGFEALDAGMFFYRKNFLRIQAAWFFYYLPFIIATAFVPRHLLWIPPLAVWWFRPVWERIILKVTARLFFGTGRGSGPGGIFRGILSDLTWRRLSFWRHYTQPVRVLEGIRGKRLRKRVSFLLGEYRGIAFALGITMFLLEITIVGGAVSFVSQMVSFVPHAIRIDLSWESPGVIHAIIIGWEIICAVTIPATVSMGFSLYVNRRVTLEGWDLEVIFRKAVSRLKASTVALVLMAIIGLGPAAAPLRAEEAPPVDSLAQVLEDEDFGYSGTRTAWRWKNRDTGSSGTSSDLPDLFSGGSNLPASLLRIIVIAAAVLAVGIIIYRNRKTIFPGFGKRSRNEDNHPGPEVSVPEKEPLPPLDTARSLHERGKIREAWSVLYRHLTAALAGSIEDPPGDDATEGEWLARTKESGTGTDRVIRGWQSAAYAHRDPGNDAFTDSSGVVKSITGGSEE